MEQLKRYRIPIIGGVAIVVVTLIVWSAWISPEATKAANLGQQKTTLQSQEQSLQSQLTTLKIEQRNVKANCGQLTRDLTMIPTDPQASQFLQQVTALAQASGDPNTPSYSLGATAAKATAGVSAVSVTLSLTGTFGQMMSFIHGLSTFPRLFTISTIQITGGPVITGNQLAAASAPGYSVTMSGQIYYAAAGQANICNSLKK